MNEQELRSLVRAAVARHLGTVAPTVAPAEIQRTPLASPTPIPRALFTSHTMYPGLVNADDSCVIEPAVKCDHCGYCKSHGF